MPRNITAAQKGARDFYKSDVLTQTNQKNYDYFFLAWHWKHQQISQDLKVETKIPARLFKFYIVI